MRRRPTQRGLLVVLFIAFIFVLMMIVEARPYPGQLCNWASDCGWNETCVQIPYHQRDSQNFTGVCMPK